MDTSLSPEERAELLIDAMTLDQKIQQIYNEPVYNEDLDVDGDPDTDGRTRLDCDFTPVGRHIEGIPELGIPDFRQANGGTGIRGGDCVPEPVATALPAQISSAATFNAELNYRWGELLDVELRAWAHHALWGPVVNLIRTPYGGRNNEFFSEDPYLSGVLGSEIIKGLQARGVSHGTIKHFVANDSEYQFERWTSANRVPPRAMHELYLLPFEMVVKDADVASVMCAYPHVNGMYNCDNATLLQDILRDQWGFDGYVYSDRRAQQSTVPSVLAGVSVELDETAEWYTPELIMAAIARGEITEGDIDALLRPRYIKMFEFGDFDDPHTEFLWDELDPLIERGGEHAQFAKEAAAESLVLLRNDNDMLPLDAGEVDSIALIGAEWFAGEATLPPRSGNREENISVVEPYQVTPEEGLEEVLSSLGSDATVTYNNGDVLDDAVSVVEESDVTILMIGDVARETWDKNSNWREENPGGTVSGAGNEIPDLDLPSVEGTNQQMLIERVLDADPNAIVVLKTQGQVNMPRLDDMHTLVQAWYPGQEDGAVVAEALFGVTNFSGKLPMTIGNTDREAAFATQLQYPGQLEDTGVPGGVGRDPLCNDTDEVPPCEESGPAPQRVVRYLEDLEMGYRWYEANGVDPVFPFGYGLSYTTFEYSDLSVESSTDPETGAELVTVEYTITNTGDRAGKEASQVYLTLPREADEPSKRLVAFDKVDLEPGESEQVSVVLDGSASNHPFSYFRPDHPDDLERWAEGEWVTPNGAYTVHVGGSSQDTPLTGSFRLGQSVDLTAYTVTSPDGPEAQALSGATVELVDGEELVPVGTTDENGHLAFEVPGVNREYTVVVRREATEDQPAYLLHRQVSVRGDQEVVFAPRILENTLAAARQPGADFVTRVELAFDQTSEGHEAITYLRGSQTAPFGFGVAPGELIATIDSYEAVNVHDVPGTAQDWVLPSEIIDGLEWIDPVNVEFAFGGDAQVVIGEVDVSGAPEVSMDWAVTDAYGHEFATVLRTGVQPFAAMLADPTGGVVLEDIEGLLRERAPEEELPLLQLFGPDGEEVNAGSVEWDQDPFTITLPDDAPDGTYRVVLTVDTGPYSGEVSDEATFQIGEGAAGVTRLAGDDRYLTAIEIGKVAAPDSTHVVLAGGQQARLVDGLVAAPLGAHFDAPVLLTPTDGLHAAVREELTRRGADHVTIVGGEGAVSPAVASELEGMGITVDRLGGQDRWETAALVAEVVGGTEAVIASGIQGNLVDALGASGPAAASASPILLVRPDSVPPATAEAVADYSSTVVVGGTGVIPDEVMAQLPDPVRAGGADRYETATLVADHYRDAGLSADSVTIASGMDQNMVDALPGGTLQQLVLLIQRDDLPDVTETWLTESTDTRHAHLLGGTGAISDAVQEVIAGLLVRQ